MMESREKKRFEKATEGILVKQTKKNHEKSPVSVRKRLTDPRI
jgi:hypothetical protein